MKGYDLGKTGCFIGPLKGDIPLNTHYIRVDYKGYHPKVTSMFHFSYDCFKGLKIGDLKNA